MIKPLRIIVGIISITTVIGVFQGLNQKGSSALAQLSDEPVEIKKYPCVHREKIYAQIEESTNKASDDVKYYTKEAVFFVLLQEMQARKQRFCEDLNSELNPKIPK